MKRISVGCSLFAATVALLTAALHMPAADRPEELEIKASYTSFDVLDGSWQLTLRDPGVSSLLVYKRVRDGEKPVAIAAERLAALRSVIVRERFFQLKDRYGDMPVDGPARRMEIRQGRLRKRVTIYSLGERLSKREAEESDRAMRVWFAIRDCFQDPDAST